MCLCTIEKSSQSKWKQSHIQNVSSLAAAKAASTLHFAVDCPWGGEKGCARGNMPRNATNLGARVRLRSQRLGNPLCRPWVAALPAAARTPATGAGVMLRGWKSACSFYEEQARRLSWCSDYRQTMQAGRKWKQSQSSWQGLTCSSIIASLRASNVLPSPGHSGHHINLFRIAKKGATSITPHGRRFSH